MRYYIFLFFLSLSLPIHPENLTLEEKIGQLLIVHYHGNDCNENAKRLITEAHAGAFIFYPWANELSSFEQVHNLCSSLQDFNQTIHPNLPLFFSIDQEGGFVVRLQNGFSSIPSALALGKTRQPKIAFLAAKTIGEELNAVGIHINLAPVADLSSASNSSYMKNRSFGSDPHQVALFAEEAIKGYLSAGILPVLKHFPGHGSASLDSHFELPLILKTKKELLESDLYPFSQLLSEAPALMTAHLLIPSLDPQFPATLSHATLTRLLREEWKYKGVVISDSLSMQGVLQNGKSIEEVCLCSLLAGCDLLCLGGKALNENTELELSTEQVIQIHHFLVQAVQKGILSEKRIDESAQRVLALKKKYTTPPSLPLRPTPQDISSITTILHRLAELPEQTTEAIAHQIWKNEGNHKEEFLLFWNSLEPFLSLGIGHFIWYPETEKKTYQEGFPQYLQFAKAQKASMPVWLESLPPCPWPDRETFLQQKHQPQAQELLQWLSRTTSLQARFLLHRLQATIIDMWLAAKQEQKQSLTNNLLSMTLSPQGIYALIDYLNFKGSGLLDSERYQSKGWGLFQALTEMNTNPSLPPIDRWIAKTSELLILRVQNAPKPEEQFLKGWLQRISTYREFSPKNPR